MKFRTVDYLNAVVAAGVFLAMLKAAASTLLSTEAIIEALDVERGTLRATTKSARAPAHFCLTKRTKFVYGQHRVTAKEVKPGSWAVLYYSYRLGQPFAKKIVWF